MLSREMVANAGLEFIMSTIDFQGFRRLTVSESIFFPGAARGAHVSEARAQNGGYQTKFGVFGTPHVLLVLPTEQLLVGTYHTNSLTAYTL